MIEFLQASKQDDDYKQLVAFSYLWLGVYNKFSKRWDLEKSTGEDFQI
ncbi:hypothetical protein [Glaciecola sp. SC05]